jgi:signal transduction histidine kinase
LLRIWRSNSLQGGLFRMITVLLVLSNMVALSLYLQDRQQGLARMGGSQAGQRLAQILENIITAPPAAQDQLLEKFNRADLKVFFSGDDPLGTYGVDSQSTDPTHSQIRSYLQQVVENNPAIFPPTAQNARTKTASKPTAAGHGAAAGAILVDTLTVPVIESRYEHVIAALPANAEGRVDVRAALGMRFLLMDSLRDISVPRAVRMAVKLDQDLWINILVPAPPEPSIVSGRLLLVMLIVTLGTIIITNMAIRKSVRPLATLADAADAFGKNLDAAPLPENGPKEVQHTARAFNQMQGRLKRYLEDRTRTLAAISHDLRTPITRMRLRAEFMDDESHREKTLQDLDDMEQMIAATLAFAKDDASQEDTVCFDLAARINSLVADKKAMGASIWYVGCAPCLVMARPVAIMRMVGNLVENALKYGHEATVLLEKTVAESGENMVVLTVQDQGTGIAEAHWPHIFRPFYRVDAARSRGLGGTGLGLSVVANVVHAHGGHITLENTRPKGFAVRVFLPQPTVLPPLQKGLHE